MNTQTSIKAAMDTQMPTVLTASITRCGPLSKAIGDGYMSNLMPRSPKT